MVSSAPRAPVKGRRSKEGKAAGAGEAMEENEGEEMEQHGDGESCAGNYLIDEHGCEDGEEEEEHGDQQKDLGRLFVRKNLLKLSEKKDCPNVSYNRNIP